MSLDPAAPVVDPQEKANTESVVDYWLRRIFWTVLFVAAAVMPIAECYRGFQERGAHDQEAAIQITFELGKSWSETYTDENRQRLAKLTSIFKSQTNEGDHISERLNILQKFCNTISCETCIYDPSYHFDSHVVDLLHIKAPSKERADASPTSNAPTRQAIVKELSADRWLMLTTMNSFEEAAMMRKHIDGTPTQEIIREKIWGNVVKRVDDFHLFIDVYNKATYWDRGSNYKAWSVLLDEVSKSNEGEAFHVGQSQAYIDKCRQLELVISGPSVSQMPTFELPRQEQHSWWSLWN